jgi:hypothetical protein
VFDSHLYILVEYWTYSDCDRWRAVRVSTLVRLEARIECRDAWWAAAQEG